jgi:hypothetical protein
MTQIRTVNLELIRPGPAHNQLLSPITPYLALCGADGPVTVSLPFEQRHLAARLQRLRYADSRGNPIVEEQREAEVRDMGEQVGRVLGQVPALLSEIGNARAEGNTLVHVRLSLSAFELALVPFEFAVGSDGFPQSGSPLFLQSRAPIVLTREVRRGRPLPVEWARPPRILFAFASPLDLPAVPAQDHLRALRKAIQPWVNWRGDEQEQLQQVKTILTVLPNATLDSLRDKCAQADFTHVHILAHGARPEHGGDRRYGVALCSKDDPSKPHVIDGERLAMILTATDSSGVTRNRPTLVSLATCDSGNVEEVLMPGGSIAHELHATGIPWVIASQFPLWMRSSTIATEVLYQGILEGQDPRWVLFRLRQRLRTSSAGTHDWASIVAYATVPWDFDRQVAQFHEQQVRAKIEVQFDHAERLLDVDSKGENQVAAEVESIYTSIRVDMRKWCDELGDDASPRDRAERLGMSAASEKRIGILFSKQKNSDQARSAYERARDFYKRAWDIDPVNHWVVTQYLSFLAVLAAKKDTTPADAEREAWGAARQIASWERDRMTGTRHIWALSTLAELELLGAVYWERFEASKAQTAIVDLCSKLLHLVGRDGRAVAATLRQFKRYLDVWDDERWRNLAQAAVGALEDGRRG